MKASELKETIEKAMSICRKEPEDEQRRRKKVDLFEILTDDILADILKRLPEAFLGYRAKYVCKRWLDVISKRNLLTHASFIIQKRGKLTARIVDIKEEGEEEGLQVKVQDLDIPFKGEIRSWGKEFLLLSSDFSKTNKTRLYVHNLITKEGSYLPNCIASCKGNCTAKCGVAISYDGFKGICKVVHLSSSPQVECHILILTEDIVSSKWKKIQVPCMNGDFCFFPKSVSVQSRYIHWRVYDDDEKRLVSMDMVKEEIADIILPITGVRRDYDIFEMGGSLALFVQESLNQAEIKILTDFKRNKWDKLQSVALENWFFRKSPVCGVMSNKYIIQETKYYNDGIWSFDLRNGVVKKLDIHLDEDDRFWVHSSPASSK